MNPTPSNTEVERLCRESLHQSLRRRTQAEHRRKVHNELFWCFILILVVAAIPILIATGVLR